MVAPDPSALATGDKLPRFIYIAGCDGTGKTTQSRLLLEQLHARGVKASRLWLRFPFFFSLPLLAYARLRGYSWHEVSGGARHGYWDFRRSWLMRSVFPWVLLLDAALASLLFVYIPLWLGNTIVCERFTLDMLVDLAVASKDCSIYDKLIGRMYLRLIPAKTNLFILNLDAGVIRQRRKNLKFDRKLDERVAAFRQILPFCKCVQIPCEYSIEYVNKIIRKVID